MRDATDGLSGGVKSAPCPPEDVASSPGVAGTVKTTLVPGVANRGQGLPRFSGSWINDNSVYKSAL